MEFHTKLAILMERRGMTQSALGEMLGVTHRAVGNWLDGSKPHSRRALDLANVFGVSAEELLDDAVDLAVTSSKQNTGETITGYTKPVPIRPRPFGVSEEGAQAHYWKMNMRSLLEEFNDLPLHSQAKIGRALIVCLTEQLDHERNKGE